jgi:DUF971 family protein
MADQPLPRTADLVTPFLLRIQWRDGITTEHKARDLRLACPCAGCIEEHTGKKILQDDSVPQDILLITAEAVGRYALSFVWSDMHRTGIFSWPYLRRLAGVPEASAG